MKNPIQSGALVLLVLVLSGCAVSQSTHEQTLDELQAAKSDLDRTRALNETLKSRVKILKEFNAKLQNEVASLNAEAEKDRQAAENKLKELDRQVKELAIVKKSLTQELEVEKQRNENHLKTIRRQQKELRERGQAALLPPPAPAKPAAPAAPEPPKDSVAPATASGLVDINKASMADLIVVLGLSKDDSNKLIRNRPYKTTQELVSKAGLPKTTVENIKDKVSLGP